MIKSELQLSRSQIQKKTWAWKTFEDVTNDFQLASKMLPLTDCRMTQEEEEALCPDCTGRWGLWWWKGECHR